MRTLLLIAMLLAAAPAAAQKWAKFADTTSRIHYIDLDSIRVSRHLRSAWILQNLKRRETPEGEMSARMLFEFDCKENRIRGLSGTSHSEPLAAGRVLDWKSGPFPWDYIAPGTAFAVALNLVCDRKQ